MIKPAILGGEKTFEEKLHIIKPTLPKFDDISQEFKETLESGMITNYKNVKILEEKICEYVGVDYCTVLANCTSGLILKQQALGIKGKVITPSFTFVATTESILWNNLEPVFVDVDPKTFLMDLEKLEVAIDKETEAILAVNIFGNPYNMEKIQKIADDYDLKLLFDSAHAFGSHYKNKKLGGFGAAESFSMTPTKVITACEGGFVTTTNEKLDKMMKSGRDYGNFGAYDCRFSGLSSRMSELNAIVGVHSLEMLEENVKKRNALVDIYSKNLSKLPGIKLQEVMDDCRSAYQTFTISIDAEGFGINRDELALALSEQNIASKTTYFSPANHQQPAFKDIKSMPLPETEKLEKQVISLPLYSHLELNKVEKVCEAISLIHENADEVRNALSGKK